MTLRFIIAWLVTLALVAGSFWFVIEEDLNTAKELESTYARKKMLLDVLNSLPEQERVIKNQLADLGGEAASAFLYEGEALTVQSFIQRDMRKIASELRINLSTMRPLGKSKAESDLLSVASVQINFKVTHEKLMQFLDRLEQAKPILRAKRVSVRVQRSSTPNRAAILAVVMDINAFRQVGAGNE